MQFAQGKNILKKNGKNEFLEPPLSKTTAFLKLEGKKSGDVLMLSNDFRNVKKPYILDKFVSSKEVTIK